MDYILLKAHSKQGKGVQGSGGIVASGEVAYLLFAYEKYTCL